MLSFILSLFMALGENQGKESGSSDSTHSPVKDPVVSVHEKETGEQDRTLIGENSSKKYNDAAGFISDGKVETTEMDAPQEDTKMLYAVRPNSEQKHSIERIMSRPVKIDTLTFSTASTPGVTLQNYDVLDVLRNHANFRLCREKLSSFYGVNFTAHLKITLNAQPFESGLFQIFFVPFTNTYTQTVDVLATGLRSVLETTLPFSTGCPNVLCNVAKQSEVELSIPYTGPVSFINLTNTFHDFGRFYVQSIVPLSDATNNASCELSVYMYFTDIDLFGTTAHSVIRSTPALRPQAPIQPPCNEADMKTKGPITMLGNSLLPVLDQLGLSAPSINHNPERRVINPYADPATADSTKNALKISYLSSHNLKIGHLGVNTKQDEMDISTVISKPTYFDQFQWRTDQEEGTKIAEYKVEPNCVLAPINTTEESICAPTRLRFMANCFRYWRGTMQFTFLVVANKFHSGRLRFVYSLGGTSNGVEDFPSCFTQVVDLRDATHFIVECPFFASTAWRVVPQNWNINQRNYITSGTGTLDDFRATLDVYIENELRAASTTSQSIQIVCLQSGGDDFEFSVPIATRSFPVIDDNEQGSFVELKPQGIDFEKVVMVSGESNSEERPITNPHPFTVGEEIRSVRTLIKRYQMIGSGQFTLTSDNPFRDYILYPYRFIKPQNPATCSYEMLAYFRTIYKFFRGSIRYMLTVNTPNIDWTVRYDPDFSEFQEPQLQFPVFGNKAPIEEVTSWPQGSSFVSTPMTATMPFANYLQGGLEIEVPYYSRYHKIGCSFDTDFDLYPDDLRHGKVPAGVVAIQVYTREKTNDAIFCHVLRAAADDFNYGYLLGAPYTRTRVIPTA